MNATRPSFTARAIIPIAALAALSLNACSEEKERTFETRTEDLSGGEFIVTPEDREGVEVNIPSTPMTPVPQDGAAATRAE
ncbi:MAG: hypothetical protein ACXIT4_04395 [Erythrobacter sp.]